MGMNGISNLDTHLYPLRNNSSVHLTTTTEVRSFGRITDRMLKGWRALRNTVISYPTRPSIIALPREAWSGSTASAAQCQTFPLLLAQMGYDRFYGLRVWRRRSNRRTCCFPMSNPSPTSWIPRPDGCG